MLNNLKKLISLFIATRIISHTFHNRGVSKDLYFFTEILPIVEFELEEGITDEEAKKLIEEPRPSSDSSSVSEDQLTISSAVADLFTARLIRYEACIGSSLFQIHPRD